MMKIMKVMKIQNNKKAIKTRKIIKIDNSRNMEIIANNKIKQ